MKTLKLVQEKEKLSGQLFHDVKSGKIEHPLQNCVSINTMYHLKSGKLKPTFIFISPKSVSIDSGWSILSGDGNNEVIDSFEGTILDTPYGKFEIYDTPSHCKGYPVSIRPYEYITDIYLK